MKNLEVQSNVIFKNPNFQCFSWTGESWEVQLEHRSKIPIFLSLDGLGKTWKYSVRPRFKSSYLNLYVNWERLCPNLSFTVKNKMGSFDKAGCISNLTDKWDSISPQISGVFNQLGKICFLWEKWNLNPLEILCIPQNVWPMEIFHKVWLWQ